MKILVTGSDGFMGFHLSRTLLEDGCDVLGADNVTNYYDPFLKWAPLNILRQYANFRFELIDIVDTKKLGKVFKGFNASNVVNLATQVGVRYGLENPYASWTHN